MKRQEAASERKIQGMSLWHAADTTPEWTGMSTEHWAEALTHLCGQILLGQAWVEGMAEAAVPVPAWACACRCWATTAHTQSDNSFRAEFGDPTDPFSWNDGYCSALFKIWGSLFFSVIVNFLHENTCWSHVIVQLLYFSFPLVQKASFNSSPQRGRY